MADLPPPRCAGAAHLADRARREIVLQVERLVAAAVEVVDQLRGLVPPKRAHGHDLRLAAREERRAVGARQSRGLGPDGAHVLPATPVGAQALLAQHAAHGVGAQRFDRTLHMRGIVLALAILTLQRRVEQRARRRQGLATLLLLRDAHRAVVRIARRRSCHLQEVIRRQQQVTLVLWLAHSRRPLLYGRRRLCDGRLPHLDGLEQRLLG
mmetsp:Transcript_7731/g.31426  ORF Transcript_7731/g.31426 Transcript_7731/m.31426 type:complete len:210 (-) Transcript_7731:662-1291(-)